MNFSDAKRASVVYDESMFKVNGNNALSRQNYYSGEGVVSITGNLGSEKIDVGIDEVTVKNTNGKLNMPYTVS